MKLSRLAVCATTSFIFAAAWAADPVDPADHKAHHPESVSTPAKNALTLASTTAAKESMKKMDEQMKMMRDMHEKMTNAKTPEERSALMSDHMKTMQVGMAMMGNMNKMAADAKTKMKGEMPADMGMHQMMEKRMEMMESMMQMMMDRIPVAAPLPAK